MNIRKIKVVIGNSTRFDDSGIIKDFFGKVVRQYFKHVRLSYNSAGSKLDPLTISFNNLGQDIVKDNKIFKDIRDEFEKGICKYRGIWYTQLTFKWRYKLSPVHFSEK